jgi:hypothetical protein
MAGTSLSLSVNGGKLKSPSSIPFSPPKKLKMRKKRGAKDKKPRAPPLLPKKARGEKQKKEEEKRPKPHLPEKKQERPTKISPPKGRKTFCTRYSQTPNRWRTRCTLPETGFSRIVTNAPDIS